MVLPVLVACSSDGPGEGAESPANDGGAAEASSADGGGDTKANGRDAGSTRSDGGGPADAGPLPCTPGLGFRWTCSGQNRTRCVDAVLSQEACSFGCVTGAGGDDDECACGANATFTYWNCQANRDLHACPGGKIYASRSCEGRGCATGAVGTDDRCTAAANVPFAKAIADLGAQCGAYSPGSTCGIAVRDLATGALAQVTGDTPYVSASSAKAIWVAAALYDRTIADVSPFASPVFVSSDNTAAGQVIDLLASPARVNTFMWNDVALASSGFCHWNFDHARDATKCPNTMGGDNFFTANDMVAFLTAVHGGRLLDLARTKQLADWMLLSPRSGYGGWLGTQLPATARATMRHKAGWLPPSAVPGYSNSNEIGIVTAANGHDYAVALLLSGAPSQAAYDAKQLPVLEYASCVVYHAVSGDTDPFGPCTHP